MDFPIVDLMDQEGCRQKLFDLLHPEGFACPRCGARDGLNIHRHHPDSPVVDHRCKRCRRVFNMFTKSLSHKGVSGRLAVAELGVGLVRLEPVDHHLDHRQLDERLRRQHRLLPIQVQPPAPAQPGERPLNGLIANDKFCLIRLFRMAP
jgi:hypothetical protein